MMFTRRGLKISHKDEFTQGVKGGTHGVGGSLTLLSLLRGEQLQL